MKKIINTIDMSVNKNLRCGNIHNLFSGELMFSKFINGVETPVDIEITEDILWAVLQQLHKDYNYAHRWGLPCYLEGIVGSQTIKIFVANSEATRKDMEVLASKIKGYLDEKGICYKICNVFQHHTHFGPHNIPNYCSSIADEIKWPDISCIVAKGECGANLTWSLDEERTLTISGAGDMYSWDWESPSPWFDNSLSIKKIVINDGVTSIGDDAFRDFYSLTSVIISDSVKSIGRSAFNSCDNLTSVTIGSGVTTIGNCAFAYCPHLTDFVIGDKVASIGNYAFGNCNNLTTVTIGDSVTYINGYAFADCDNLIDVYYHGTEEDWNNISIGNGNASLQYTIKHYDIKAIVASGTCGDNLTWKLDQDGTLTISGTGDMYSWDNWSFNTRAPWNFTRCTVKHVIIEDGVTTIGAYAFAQCYGITDVTIPDGVKKIGSSAFGNCRSLTSVTIPDGVTTIGGGVFSHCTSLTTVVIGNKVATIDSYAFSNCFNLTHVYYNGTEEQWSKIFIDEGNTSLTNAAIHFNHIAAGTCGDNLTWALDQDGTLTISGIGAMTSWSSYSLTPWSNHREKVKKIIIGDSVRTIGDSAFRSCRNLTSVTIGDGVTTIGNDAFWHCESLASITIPDSVTSIGYSAFYSCYRLTSVVIGHNVSNIGGRAFYACYSLTDIYFNGTAEEWNNINFKKDWSTSTSICAVHYNNSFIDDDDDLLPF